jgi:hypothetical protein
MPEMSTYYYAWIAANVNQSHGLSLLAGGALSMLISWLSLPLLPTRYRLPAEIVLQVFIAALVLMLAVILWRA